MHPRKYRPQDGIRITKQSVSTVQINLGNRCNQTCSHCHIQASPEGKHMMNKETAAKVMRKINRADIQDIEFTGGAPELNPHLPWCIEELSHHNKRVTVRTNLTVLDMQHYDFFFDLYRTYRVKIVASLPCYLQENVDAQRGAGVYAKSLNVLKKLNELGYGKNDLVLDLVYNPSRDILPPPPQVLQREYERFLHERFGIVFNRVIPITNVPIGRFAELLRQQKRLKPYLQFLQSNVNPATLDRLMCRKLISINYAGYVYDCDFNLALDRRVNGYETVKFWEIDLAEFSPDITFDNHCYACTAGHGSSCYGALIE